MSEEIRKGVLYVVSTPIGNLDDITLRAVHILRSVDLIAAEDTRTTRVLLDRHGIDKPLISCFSYNERRRVPDLLDRMRRGGAIAVVTDAGTPGISDPAYVVIREVIAAGFDVIPSPGASAVLAALVASGLPTDRFVFEGFLPLKKGRKTRWERLAQEERTIVIYESPHRIVRTLGDVLAMERGTVSEVLSRISGKTPRGEYVLVIAGTTYRSDGADDHNDPRI